MARTTCATAEAYLASMRDALRSIAAAQRHLVAYSLFGTQLRGKSVFVFGNRGSAHTASHFTTDFMKTSAVLGQKRLRCFSLTDNCGLITALGNDISFDDVFVYMLSTYADPGDVAVAISCSGDSPNVLRACQWAGANGLTLVCLSGCSGGKMAAYADLHINIPHENYGLIEDLHLSIGHIVTQALQARVQAGMEMGI